MYKRTLVKVLTIAFLFCYIGFAKAADTIKVGAPLSLTGAYAADGLGYLRGVETAVNEINEAGGLLGKKLEIVKFDTQELIPELVMQAADQLMGKEKVDSVHGGWTGSGLDVRAYGRYNIPVFMWDGSIDAINVYRENPDRYSNVFQLIDTAGPIAKETFKLLQNLPLDYPNKLIAIIAADDSWGMECALGWKEIAAQKGWKTVVFETVPYGTREWGPILTRIRKAEPAIIYLEISRSPDLITFFRQFMKDPTPSLVHFGYGVAIPDFLPTLGAEGNGLMGYGTGLPGPIAPNPRSQAWVDKFSKTYASEPTAGSIAVYTGVRIWAAAVKAVGDEKNHNAVNAYVAENEFIGLTGHKLRFDQDHKISNHTWPISHLQIQDGKMITIYHGPNKYLDYQFQKPTWIE